MNNRMQQFIAAENISQSQFADTIGVARASVSHILAGRNKPGFDFIESMSRHFPNLNLEWLINGKGKMYKSGAPSAVGDDDLFAGFTPQEKAPEQETATTAVTPEPKAAPAAFDLEAASPQPAQQAGIPLQQMSPSEGKSISRIIIFFDDNTFRELK